LGQAREKAASGMSLDEEAAREQLTLWGGNAVLGAMQNAWMDGERFAKREMQLAILSEVWALTFTLAVLRSPCSTSLRGANPNVRAVNGEPCVLTPLYRTSGWG
jgi:hypothetical protein